MSLIRIAAELRYAALSDDQKKIVDDIIRAKKSKNVSKLKRLITQYASLAAIAFQLMGAPTPAKAEDTKSQTIQLDRLDQDAAVEAKWKEFAKYFLSKGGKRTDTLEESWVHLKTWINDNVAHIDGLGKKPSDELLKVLHREGYHKEDLLTKTAPAIWTYFQRVNHTTCNGQSCWL